MSGSMRGVWKRSYGCATKHLRHRQTKRGGNRHAQPKTTALHSYSTHCRRPVVSASNDRGPLFGCSPDRAPHSFSECRSPQSQR